MFVIPKPWHSFVAALYTLGAYQVLLALFTCMTELSTDAQIATAGVSVIVTLMITAMAILMLVVALASGAFVANAVSDWVGSFPSWKSAFAEMSSIERKLVLGMVNLIVTSLLIVQLSYSLPA